MLRGSFGSEYGASCLRRHGYTTLPAYRVDLTHRVTPLEQGKSILPPPHQEGKYIARCTDGSVDSRSGRKRMLLCNGADTSCVGHADNITGRESAQTSLRCFTRENWVNRHMRRSR